MGKNMFFTNNERQLLRVNIDLYNKNKYVRNVVIEENNSGTFGYMRETEIWKWISANNWTPLQGKNWEFINGKVEYT